MKKYSKKKITKIPLKRKKIQKKYTSHKKNIKKKSSLGFFKVVIYTVLFFIILCFVMSIILYNKILKVLPNISELENYNIAERSIIYDRNGKELYSIFKEKRTYVAFDHISKNMINAIVAGEDKKFWTNPGIDVVGLIRAGVNFATRKSDSFGGTSTLTQQLIRNTIIEKKSNEGIWEGIERKLKELYLAYQLTKKGSSKEKILELYLNKIAYGHNAYGIEEAAKTFFNKSSKDLDVLESSILASLPKGPTYYSPYNRPARLLGSPVIISPGEDTTEVKTKLLTKKDIVIHSALVEKLKKSISDLKGKPVKGSNVLPICGINKDYFGKQFKIDTQGCAFVEYGSLDNLIGSIKITSGEKTIGYNSGRKDYILQRMLEDGYITFEDYKKSVIRSFGYQFHQTKEKISAPHFVFYIKEYLEQKYGQEAIAMGGFKIYTSLDLDAQKQAEQIIKKQVAINKKKFNAKNAALITIDNTNGDIISMVGGVDYFDKENKGNVNVITSKIQPGSSFKPFVYSLGMKEKQIGTKTPIYDVKTKFPGGYQPKNYDGKFIGKTNISTALNHSRNIPAIKMYYMAGGKKNIVDFMKKLGVKSLDANKHYGASLALGTGEMTALELAEAYSVFANMGKKVDINPIIKIVDAKGNIIEEKKDIKKANVISSGQAFLINSIMTDIQTRPSFWNKYLTLKNRVVAAKTGTATKPVKGRQYPSHLWTIGYTPQYTTVAWAGNTDGETLKMSGNGLEGAGPIWRDFMNYIHKGKKALRWSKPDDVKSINISEITGYLPNPENPDNRYLVSSYFLNPPTKIDNSYQTVRYDALCNGIITENTPKAAIREAVVLEFHSLKPENPAWEKPVIAWSKSEAAIKKYGSTKGLLSNITNNICERKIVNNTIILKTDLDSSRSYKTGQNKVNIAFKSENPIDTIEILINDIVTKTISVGGKQNGGISENIFIAGRYNNSKIKVEIRALDSSYYSGSETKNLIISSSEISNINPDIINNDITEPDTTPENNTVSNNTSTSEKIKIQLINPKNGSIKIYEDSYFNLRANFTPSPKSINILINGKIYKKFSSEKNIVLPINKIEKFNLGVNNMRIQAINNDGKMSEKVVNFDILRR